MSQLLASGGQSIGASTSAAVFPMNIQGVGESHCKQKDLQCEQHLCDQGAGLEAGCMPLRASASLNLHPGHFSCPTLIQDLAGRVEFGQEEF